MTALPFTAPSQDEPAFTPPPASESPSWLAHQLPAGWLIAALLLWLGLDQLLLWRFLDIMPVWAYPLGMLLIVGLCVATVRAMPDHRGPTVAILIACLAVALILLMLGGEGHFFYANIDWQVRFAVLRDMGLHPWPFVYGDQPVPALLRAPIGMFLVPALAAKAAGDRAGDLALLIQNSLMLAAMLSLGATLFDTRRAPLIALLIFLAFSGLDALGRMLFRGGLSDHLENWAYLQYSSTITLAFWVPNHALSGWIGALGYLLWRRDRLPLATYLSLLPLTALWSPLGLMGAMPFAALAAIRTLRLCALAPATLLYPALATLLAVPGLAYMSAAPADVGARIVALAPLQWGLFELLEVLVYALPLAWLGRSNRFGLDTLLVATAWLLLIPFVQIGWSTDFMMRGSISALAILAVMLVDALGQGGMGRRWLIAMLLIGSITGLAEIRRALAYPAAPQVRCSFSGAWDQSFGSFPKGSYLAPLPAMPAWVRPANPARIHSVDPTRCWDGAWHHPDKPDAPTSDRQDRVE